MKDKSLKYDADGSLTIWADNKVSNGIIHGIDKVLMPKM